MSLKPYSRATHLRQPLRKILPNGCRGARRTCEVRNSFLQTLHAIAAPPQWFRNALISSCFVIDERPLIPISRALLSRSSLVQSS